MQGQIDNTYFTHEIFVSLIQSSDTVFTPGCKTSSYKVRFCCVCNQRDSDDFYPKKAVRVLREDCVPPVVCVRVWHHLYSCPQQLIPQQGSVRHSVWGGGGRGNTEATQRVMWCTIKTLQLLRENCDFTSKCPLRVSDLCLSLSWRPLLCGSDWESGSSPVERSRTLITELHLPKQDLTE